MHSPQPQRRTTGQHCPMRRMWCGHGCCSSVSSCQSWARGSVPPACVCSRWAVGLNERICVLLLLQDYSVILNEASTNTWHCSITINFSRQVIFQLPELFVSLIQTCDKNYQHLSLYYTTLNFIKNCYTRSFVCQLWKSDPFLLDKKVFVSSWI